MYKKIKEYVEISPREFRGMFIFIIIMLLLIISPYIYERIAGETLKISIETLTPKIADIESFDEKKNNFYEQEEKEVHGELFDFDPNNLSVDNWVKLGLSEKQALSIKRYETKGGEFRSLADVKKMYAISPEMFQRLEPHIKIPTKQTHYKSYSKNNDNNTFGARTAVNIELNSADSIALITIRGVGPSFAVRILKYRNKLGGFISLNQLKEIYGIDSAKFDQIIPQVTIDAKNIRKISINRCSLDDFKDFPYLNYKQKNAIVAYRLQHGNFNNAKDLNKIAILNPELIQKITPYLNFND